MADTWLSETGCVFGLRYMTGTVGSKTSICPQASLKHTEDCLLYLSF